MHPALEAFFAPRYDELLAAMRKAAGRSSDVVGTARESGVKKFFDETLRPLARIESGDIVDASGKSTGQLDAVLLHPGIPSLQLGENTFTMFGEAAVAVVEVKSNARTQWDEVEKTWEKIIPIRRTPPFVHLRGAEDRTSSAVPFVVIGLEGWEKASTVEKHAQALRTQFGADCPPTFVLNLDPPIYAVADASGASSAKLEHAHRGRMLAHTWAYLVELTRTVSFRYMPWHAYLGV